MGERFCISDSHCLLSCSCLGLIESLTQCGVTGEHLEIVAFVIESDQRQNNALNLFLSK